MRLLDAEIGRSQAQLAGEIRVLAQAQEGLAREHRLGRELASQEHARVQSSIEVLFGKFDDLTKTVQGLSEGRAADSAVRRWRRWALGAGIAAAGLFVAAAGQLVTAL